jgi:hypothetical protein
VLYYDSIEREKLSLAITERQKYYYTANQRQALSFTVAFPKVLFASGSTVGTSISIATPTYNVNVSANAVGDSLATALPSYSIDVTAITIGTSTATAAASITETRSGTTTGSSVSTCDAKAIFIEERTASTVGTSTSTATAIGETAYSPEAQAVIDRMVNTTEKQNDAIANFVDTLVASGDWDDLYDVHCFSLGNVDYLTGWKVNAGLTPVGSPVHTENDGVQFSTTSHMDLGYSAEALHLALGIDSVCVGGYVKTSANSGVNFDLCGVVSGTGVNDFYVC